MNGARLPLTVIGGFLGAGKTTLLNRWLREAAGQRLAVLVNDFGALNVDAELIAANSGDTVALNNGCVCCQIGGDLSAALIRVLESNTRFDAVVIEASGVSDPWRIAELGRADPGLSLDGVIVLIDASTALAQSRDPLLADTLERQLKAGDLIVINKNELSDDAARLELRRWIESVAGPVPQFYTTQAAVPLPMLSSLAIAQPGATHEPGQAHRCDGAPADHGAVFETWSCRSERIFEPAALKAWLRSPPAGLLRLKGLLRTVSSDRTSAWSEIQFAGRHGALRQAVEPRSGPALVAIGLRDRLPVRGLIDFFET